MDTIKGNALALITVGSTHVIERNGAEAYVYFETANRAHMLLTDGETRSGSWRLTERGYATAWDNGSAGNWVLEHTPGEVSYVELDKGIRMRMVGVLFGNAKGLPA